MKYLYIWMAFLIAVPATATEPTAWAKTSWGMSVAQLREMLPDSVDGAGTDKKRIGTSEKFEVPALFIPDVEAGGIHFCVALHVGPDGLDQVNLQPVSAADVTELGFHRIEVALEQKYGRPFSRSGDGVMTSSWKTKTAVIELRFATVLNRLHFLDLVYSPLPKSDNF